MPEILPTAFLFFAAALVLPFLPRVLRGLILLALPVLAGWQVWTCPRRAGAGTVLRLRPGADAGRPAGAGLWPGLLPGGVPRQSLCLACADRVQRVAALLYAGSAIGAVFAGDLITLFFYWEGTAIASVFLIWARRTEGAYHTGLRYLVVQIASGVILLAGAVMYHAETGRIAFEHMTLGSPATWLIFLSFGIKCAFPLLHNWLQDSYPAATITGTVILSAFTTKLAVYALARGFAGTEILIYIGAVMTLFPIFFAEIENDLRRVLAYSLNNQLGFMVVGIGVGTEMALNGTASHAFAHILYKALLFMSVGAVMFRTGTSKASELGGLYRTMPLTAVFCLVGAASISAFPLFSGFVTKSLILDQTAAQHYPLIWAVLVFASAGVLSHSGIKIPFFTFFAHDSGKRPAEAPLHMLLAMGITAFLCIAIGVYPDPLYAILPYEVDFHPYTMGHVVGQLQLLTFALLAFAVLYRTGIHPPEIRAINLDFDWTYRRAGRAVLLYLNAVARASGAFLSAQIGAAFWGMLRRFQYSTGPEGKLAQSWPTGAMVMGIAIVLGVTLAVSFFS
ncbi:MAG: Na(+)/H(+) antiporter subunit D [Paracoccaceae bacterium]